MPLAPFLLIETAIVFAFAGAAAILVRDSRRRLLWIAALFGAALIVTVSSGLLAGFGFARTANAVTFVGAVMRGIALINLAAVILFSVMLRAVRIDVPRILRDLAIAFAYIVLLLYLFSRYKVDIVGIVATSAVITAIIGFSLQDVLQNVMAGIALEVDQSIAPGDWLRIGDLSGLVREISWRHVAVETRDGDRVLVPNNTLMKNQVLLQGGAALGERKERRGVQFRIDYRYMPTVVIESVTEALRREPIPDVALNPEPDVIFSGFRDSAAEYAARYWLTNLRADLLIDSIIRTRIYYALRRAGIPLAIPASNVYLHRGEERALIASPNAEIRLRAIQGVPIFKSLTHDELLRVAERLIYAPFLPSEAIVVQGAHEYHLYILTRGTIEVRVSAGDGLSSPVARVQAPHFIGEGGMLTGEPRRATVVALTEVECWRLEKEAFEEVMQARPQIADEISNVLAIRNVELAAVKDGLTEEAKRLRVSAERRTVLDRIRKFFTLA